MSENFDCIVIGGGPAGSTVASFLHLMGRRVLLLERDRFPRHHIGESMIAATIDILAEIGLEKKLSEAGFPVKSGGCFIWGDKKLPWCIRFEEVPGRPTSYQVKRDVFDTILLEHCHELGVDVRQNHRVREMLSDNQGRVTGVIFQKPDGSLEEANAPITIDASGLSAILANRISRRIPAEDLRNMAVYGYWKGEHIAPSTLGGEIRPTDRNNIIIKWLGPGWLWFIPLGLDQLISVGYVAPRSSIPTGGPDVLKNYLLDRVSASPELTKLLSSCQFTGESYAIRDWSYRSERMTGPGYFAVGDAACFVDPILSSGVFLGVLYAKLCACAVNTCLGEPDTTAIIQEWYETLYDDTYRDYLQMARFWYHGDRMVSGWMHEAKDATEEDTQYSATDRSSFLGLATGNVHAHPEYVLRKTLGALGFPAKLRKDPLLGQLRAMGNALLAHSPDTESEKSAETIRQFMQKSVAHKERVARLMSQRPPVVDKLVDTDPIVDSDKKLMANPDADISVEVIENRVAVTIVARGKRRVLDSMDIKVLNGFSTPTSLTQLTRNNSIPESHVCEFTAELLGAGVLVPFMDKS